MCVPDLHKRCKLHIFDVYFQLLNQTCLSHTLNKIELGSLCVVM